MSDGYPYARIMREKTIAASFLIIAFIHAVPVVGFIGADNLERLYGVSLESPELVLLMRHRAVLFGILAMILCLGAFQSRYRVLAFVCAAGSLLPFFYLTLTAASYNAAILHLLQADFVALLALIVAGSLHLLGMKQNLKGS